MQRHDVCMWSTMTPTNRICLLLLAASCLWAPAAAMASASARQVIGADVIDPRGEKIGHVGDVVFDVQTGAIRYLSVDYGGWLGLGDRTAAVPAERITRRNGALMLDSGVNLERLPVQPRIVWPAMRATRLINREVLDRLHRDSGEIVDLEVNLQSGKVVAAVLDLRDDWKTGQHLVRAPIERFSLPRDMGRYAFLNVARERLLAEPDTDRAAR